MFCVWQIISIPIKVYRHLTGVIVKELGTLMLMLCFQVALEQSLIVLIHVTRVRNNLPQRMYKYKSGISKFSLRIIVRIYII